jgi:N-acylneuraminate cytidylyltransferase
MNYLTAIIPVRKNSQRVKNKNFKKFNNKSLLIHKINKLKKVGLFDEIIVNTDSEEAINIANKLKVSYHRREKYYASSKCPNNEFLHHVAKNNYSKYIFFTNCTSPLIKILTYKNTIQNFEKSKKKCDSLNTVNLVKDFLFLDKKAINFNINKAPNSQNLPDIYRLNFAINILSRNTMIKRMSVVGKKPYFFPLNEIEGFDIDTKFQFDFANHLHKNLFKS